MNRTLMFCNLVFASPLVRMMLEDCCVGLRNSSLPLAIEKDGWLEANGELCEVDLFLYSRRHLESFFPQFHSDDEP